jgi:hypothetical protein
MKKTDLYLLLSGCAIILNYFWSIGIILSIVLLFLVYAEKKKLKQEVTALDFKIEIRKLIIVQILCIINVFIEIIIWLGFLFYIGLAIFRGY